MRHDNCNNAASCHPSIMSILCVMFFEWTHSLTVYLWEVRTIIAVVNRTNVSGSNVCTLPFNYTAVIGPATAIIIFITLKFADDDVACRSV